MIVYILILAAIMALFGVLGYLYGTRSALLTLIVIVLGLVLIANAGGRIVTLINTIYKLIAGGGLSALTSSDTATALGQLRTRLAAIPPLIPSDASGAVLLLILIVLIVLAILLGRFPRFRRPPSGSGLLIGLANGYLIGAYLLVTLLPSLAAVLPLPFGLGGEVASTTPAAAVATGAPAAPGLTAMIESASQTSLSLVVMAVMVIIILLALVLNVRGRGGAGRGRGGGGGGGGGGSGARG